MQIIVSIFPYFLLPYIATTYLRKLIPQDYDFLSRVILVEIFVIILDAPCLPDS